MKYFDVSGCRNITDKTLEQLSKHLGKFVKEDGQTAQNCSMRVRCSFIEDLEDSQARKVCFQCSFYKNNRALQTLRLSGCYKITNQGLRLVTVLFCLQTLLNYLMALMLATKFFALENAF